MNDLISRQNVTNAIEDTDWYHINEKGEMVQGSSSELESWYKHDDIMDAIESIPSEESEIICCEDCKFTDGLPPIADGRYWCLLHSCYMYFCSDAERSN